MLADSLKILPFSMHAHYDWSISFSLYFITIKSLQCSQIHNGKA